MVRSSREGTGEVETPSLGDGRGRAALLECLEGLGRVGSPFLWVGRGREDHTEGWKGSAGLP